MNCKHEFVFVGKGIVSLSAALVVAGVLFLPGKGMAVPNGQVTLTDQGSSAAVDLAAWLGCTTGV